MPPLKILPNLHINFLLVAAIIGHLHFFLITESSDDQPTLEQVVQIYLESPSNNVVNLQKVKNLFDDTFLNVFKNSHFGKELLVKGAMKIALDNLLSMHFPVQLLLYLKKY